MPTTDLFEIPAAAGYASYLAKVVAVKDPDNLARVQVQLLNFDGFPNQHAPIWARVAVPFAGGNRGAFLLPDVGDEVLVTLVNGDPRIPIVLGGLWNGGARAPETLGHDRSRVDRWTLVGKAGTRIAIVEENAGEATIFLTTPGAVSATLTQKAGGKIELKAANNTITMDPQGVSVVTQAKVSVQASSVEVTVGVVTVDAALSTFSGMVECDTLVADTILATTYTPGAGNVW